MISFVGAGPGDEDLITVKGRRLISEADVIIFAGSLVSKAHLKYKKDGCLTYDSKSMTLEDVLKIMKKAEDEGKNTVRLHTGDPSIYGAIREQMDELEKMGIDFEVIPGVSSFQAAAAAVKKEFTLPDVSQTVILTRLEGRTPVPVSESLEKLASHKASMAIFLSVQMIHDVIEKLKEGYEDENTPVAVVYKASWDDEKVIYGSLKDIEQKVKSQKIDKMSQILVGNFLGDRYEKSKLYDKTFSHKFRKAEK